MRYQKGNILNKPYQYTVRKKPMQHFRKRRLKRHYEQTDPIPLTGFLVGKQASDIEERFGRALLAVKLRFRFQVRFPTADRAPGQRRVVDFVVESKGIDHPVEIDGRIGHRTSAQKGKDAVREILLNDLFVRWGMALLQRVSWTELETQEEADRTVRRMFG